MSNGRKTVITKVFSVVLSLVFVLGMMPLETLMVFAVEDSLLYVQYLEKGVAVANTPLSVVVEGEERASGQSDKNGIWQTGLDWESLPEEFSLVVNGDSKSIVKEEKYRKFLVVDDDEKKWMDNPAPLSIISISPEKTELLRGDTLTLTASVKGTVDSFQWYHKGLKLEGKTESILTISSVALGDSGEYTCKAADEKNGVYKEASAVVSVTNATASGVTLTAYYGDNTVNESIQRGLYDSVTLKVGNLPEDVEVENIAFVVNDNEVSSSAATECSFDIQSQDKEYSCKAVIAFASKYAELTVSMDAFKVDDLKAQDGLSVVLSENIQGTYNSTDDKYEPVYSGEPYSFDVTVSGGSGIGAYELEVCDIQKANALSPDGNYVTLSKNGNTWKVTIKNVCSFRLKATKAASGIFAASSATYVNVDMKKADMTGFAFVVSEPNAVTYNDNNNEFKNTIKGSYEGVVYSLEEGEGVAAVDADTGKVFILKAGTIKVKATLKASLNYNEATAEYSLTVNKANQGIAFENEKIELFYGQSYEQTAKPIKNAEAADKFGYNHDEGVAVAYATQKGADTDTVIAEVSEEGKLQFANQKIGNVIVTATLPGNDCYNEATASYSISVLPYSVENGYSIFGEKIEGSDWYKSDITISAAEKFSVSKSNSLTEENEWKDKLVIDTEGKDNGLNVYLKNNDTGAITVANVINPDSLKLDKSAPDGLDVEYKTVSWYENIIETTTFGYYNSQVKFILKANDSVSGVKNFIWRFTSEEEGGYSVDDTYMPAKVVTVNGTSYCSDECVIGDEVDLKDFRGRISFEAIDYAGNDKSHAENYVVVVGVDTPQVSITPNKDCKDTVINSYPYTTSTLAADNPIAVFNDEVKLDLSILCKNFFEDRATVTVSKNGEEPKKTSVNWELFGDNHKAAITLSDDGEYVVKVEYNDIFGDDIENKENTGLYEAELYFCIDTASPEVTVTFSNPDYEQDGVSYYDSDITVGFTVKEDRFRPAQMAFAKKGELSGLGEDNANYLADSDNWSENEDGTYSASVTVKAAYADDVYQFVTTYTDIAGNSVSVDSPVYTIDTRNPVPSISFDKSVMAIVNNAYPYVAVADGTDNSIDIFNGAVEVTFEVEETNFFSDRALVTVNGEDISNTLEWNKDNKATVVLDDGNYDIKLVYTDIFAKDEESSAEKTVFTADDLIAVDTTAPEITVALSEPESNIDGVSYYADDVTATVTVKESKFRPAQMRTDAVDSYLGLGSANGSAMKDSSVWAYNSEDGTYSASFTVPAEYAEGIYQFSVDYTDIAGNKAEQKVSDRFVIDTTAPVIDASYGDASILNSQNDLLDSFTKEDIVNTRIYDREKIVVTITVDEVNFNADNMKAYLKQGGSEKEISFDGDWKTEGNIHTNTVTLDKNNQYVLTVKGSDSSLNKAEDYTSPALIIDDAVPEISFSYSSDVANQYFSEDSVDVTVTVIDDFFAANRVSLELVSKDIFGYSLGKENPPAVHDGKNWQEGKNENGNTYHTFTFTLSNEARYDIKVDYADAAKDTDSAEDFFVIDRVAPTHEISYEGTFMQTLLSTITYRLYKGQAVVKVTVNDEIAGVKEATVSYPNELIPEEKYNARKLTNDSKTVSFTSNDESEDRDEAVIVWTINEEDIDIQAKANINVVAADNAGNTTADENRIDSKNVTIIDNVAPVVYSTITEEDTIQNGGFTITVEEANFDPSQLELIINQAVDIAGNPVEVPEDLQDYFRNIDNWDTSDGFTYKIRINNTKSALEDGYYVFSVKGKDELGNETELYKTPEFITDTSAPYDVKIEYSEPYSSKDVDGVTYKYYQDSAKLTFTASDSTIGIDRFEWGYNKDKNASKTIADSNDGFAYPEEVREGVGTRESKSSLTLKAEPKQQYRGWFSVIAVDRTDNDSEPLEKRDVVVVVDNIAPTRRIEYSDAEQKDSDFESGNGSAYYAGEAIATITVTEANFYPEDVVLKVNGSPFITTWKQEGDNWTANLIFSSDGNYEITMDYADRSGNKMDSITSGKIVVDTVDPVIEVTYTPDNPVFTDGNRKYYAEAQTALITVTETNFNPEDITVTFSSKDIDGADISNMNLEEHLKNPANWENEGDVHTATVNFSDDSNYTLAIACKDLALHESEKMDDDKFTVDKTAPDNLTVKYSKSVLDTVIENVSYGFYDAPVTVKVSADDKISGVKSFTYTQNQTNGAKATAKTLDAKANSSSSSVSFKVPASEAQFKGNIKVIATDNAGNNSSELRDKKTLVVDSNAPVGKVELSKPVTFSNGMSYYSGTVSAQISINEANFYADDVNVLVDGNKVSGLKWSNNGDTWTTTVSVSSDGKHKITMDYADKSGNKMTDYESPGFVIDHSKPVVTVSGIKNNSANKGDKVGFVLRAQDQNFAAGGFEPKLTAIIKAEKGGFETRIIDLAKLDSSDNSYIVKIDNLEKDGIYTLTCKASDLCGNVTDTMNVEGSDSVKSVMFSINRNGSAYMMDEDSRKLAERYYVKSVEKDIVISEVNVSPLIETGIKLNNESLVEGKDYTLKKTGGNGEWYQYTYTIKSDLFREENEYSIVLNSVDEAKTVAYSDIKGAEIMFVVDNTAPEIALSGLEKNGRYQTDKQNVNLIPTDDGGNIYSLKVEIIDKDGKVTEVPIDLNGDKLSSFLEEKNGVLTFSIPQGIKQSVKIVCVDRAGNVYNSEENFKNISVSSNRVALVWASTGFRVVFGLAVAAAAGGIFLLVILKKKKKDEEEKAK